ncbi:antitoxin family protein [Thermococcus sp. AM4]|jgi:predicted DNA-binding antitoxin AbrB/MazE fold protein|uniref:antitoxin family protein n=2 Tax=unclassified Thermococcus TaxID=2627626 RepID=UPI0001870A87|nr:antitoxin family protein [Thermococcus sp. AM4]EEB73236.1 conserved hypothetical protein [Thermococcus sp. AM4]
MGIIVEAVYENGVFKPLKKVNIPERARVRIRVEIFGLLKDWSVDAQQLKDELREVHG